MTTRNYKFIINLCLAVAALAALSFERFQNRWIPGSALLVAAGIALSMNLHARRQSS